jgi:predicted ArsR family transcriptional regulator
MPAPHRLTSLAHGDPPQAAAILKVLLDAHEGRVLHVARAIGLHVTKVHKLIARLELRDWLDEAWPPDERPRGGRPDKSTGAS